MNFPWIVPAAVARTLIGDGALVLDGRKDELRQRQPLPGAVPLAWHRLTHAELPDKGRLLDDDRRLGEILGAIGVRDDVAVVVVGDALDGGGEDGRLVWALRSLGHGRVAFVDGGIRALLTEGPLSIPPQARPGAFQVARTDRWEAGRDQLRAAIGTATIILDTREEREYRGATPYGETRGGHVPGARHLWYRDLLDAEGKVLAGQSLADRLAGLGIAAGSEIIAYCTGGVRAGFVTAVLTQAGYRARNYAGSMWHWAAGDAQSFPLG